MNSQRYYRIRSNGIEELRCELLIVYCFSNERPLGGGAGRVDWRLCGQLSQMLQAGDISGAAGECALVPSRGYLQAPRILLLGLGERSTPTPAQVNFAIGETAKVARGLRFQRLGLALPLAWLASTTPELPSLLVRSLESAFADAPGELSFELYIHAGRGNLSRETLREAFRRSPHFSPIELESSTESLPLLEKSQWNDFSFPSKS